MSHTHSGIDRPPCGISTGVSAARCPRLSRHGRVFVHAGGVSRGTAAHQFAEPEYKGVSDTIEDAVARPFSSDEPGIKQDLQVLRNVGLAPVEVVYDLIDGHRPTSEDFENSQAAGLSKHLESASD